MPHYPFLLEHLAIHEGGKHKTHIMDSDNQLKVLCGIIGGPTSGGTLHQIDKDWLMKPDSEGELCKTCKKLALVILDSLNTSTPYNS